jgi:hypothetical protein
LAVIMPATPIRLKFPRKHAKPCWQIYCRGGFIREDF